MTTKFVSSTGSNSNSGTQDSPYLTWQKGLENIVAGDTLYIRGGTYVESINSTTQTVPVGSSFTNAPIIAGFPDDGRSTIILRPASGRGLTLNQDVFQIWKDFVIDCSNCTSDGINVGGNAGARDTKQIRFQNLEVKNFPAIPTASLILAWGDRSVNGYFEFIDCVIHDHDGSDVFGHGLYINAPYCLVDGLTVYNCNNFGFHAYANASFSTESTSGLIARRIHAYSNNVGILVTGGDNLLCYNSIARTNVTDGFVAEFGTASNGTKFFNCTAYANGSRGFRIGSNQSNAQIRNCISWMNSTQISDGGSSTSQSNNLTTSDPLFRDPANGDFTLLSSSPAVDAGVNLSSYGFTTDIFGKLRG